MDNFYEGLTGEPTQGIYDISAVKNFPLGTRYQKNGRTYHYAKAGAVALVAGNLLQSAANGGTTTYQHDLTPSAAAVGAESVSVTTVTDTLAANHFADGLLAVTDGDAAMGSMYDIKSHTGGAAGALVFTLAETVKVAITTSSRITIVKNVYDGAIQAPVTTATGIIIGVAPVAVTASYYFWCQTWGMSNVLVKTALAVGNQVVRDVSAAGSVAPQKGTAADGINLIDEFIGNTGWSTDTTDSGFVFLTLNP
jgi:hypothetical protein